MNCGKLTAPAVIAGVLIGTVEEAAGRARRIVRIGHCHALAGRSEWIDPGGGRLK